MKKLIVVIIWSVSVVGGLTSCGGGSVESDAKKIAGMMCEAVELSAKAQSGDMSLMQKSLELGEKASKLMEEMEEKYESEEEKKKLGELVMKEMENCK